MQCDDLYCAHKNPPLDHIFRKTNVVHTAKHYSFNVHYKLCLASDLLLSCFPTKILYSFLMSPMRFYALLLLTPLVLITLTMRGIEQTRGAARCTAMPDDMSGSSRTRNIKVGMRGQEDNNNIKMDTGCVA